MGRDAQGQLTGDHRKLCLATRNLQRVRVLPVADLNAYELLRPRRILLTRAGLDALVAVARGETPEPAPADVTVPRSEEPPPAPAPAVSDGGEADGVER